MAELRPVGKYRGRLKDHAVVDNEKKPGEVDIKLCFELDFHEDREGNQSAAQGVAYVNIYPRSDSEKSLEIAKDQLSTLGVDDISRLGLPSDKSNLVGLGCDLWMKHEEYNGEQKERWSISTPRESLESSASASQKLKSLFGAAAKPRPKAPVAKNPKPAPASAGSDGADDDVPF